MRESLQYAWEKLSRIGLTEQEGIRDRREVIYMNRMMGMIPVIMLIYIPLEIYLNGYSTLPVVLVMMVAFSIPLLFHHYRWFRLASIFIFLIANILITGAGLMVGKGINNHVALLPVVLIAVIIFRTRTERLLSFIITALFYFAQRELFHLVTPVISISPEIKEVFSAVFFMLAMVLTFLAGIYFKSINSEYETIINEQKEALSIKNQEVTASINYARRIQNAILPSGSRVKELLPESFVIYEPKDIVAGDFYWLEEKAGTILVAAADATGHGVPGAMVSVICNNALSRAVREFDLTTPSAILDKTREIVVDEFGKSDEEVKDGMDISLASICRDKGKGSAKLRWAGANNPLLIARNGELTELKPDKQPIGKFETSKAFTNHEMELLKGDTVYMFSDGFSDQFGGPEGKKFKYKTFKRLISNIHAKPMEEQKAEILRIFNDWKGRHEQVDDVCVIGFRLG